MKCTNPGRTMKISPDFETELTRLINRYSVENTADIPDFIMAKMICRMLEVIGFCVKDTLDWHGCDSVCHPKAESRQRRTPREDELVRSTDKGVC
jgi:hypothetical protein